MVSADKQTVSHPRSFQDRFLWFRGGPGARSFQDCVYSRGGHLALSSDRVATCGNSAHGDSPSLNPRAGNVGGVEFTAPTAGWVRSSAWWIPCRRVLGKFRLLSVHDATIMTTGAGGQRLGQLGTHALVDQQRRPRPRLEGEVAGAVGFARCLSNGRVWISRGGCGAVARSARIPHRHRMWRWVLWWRGGHNVRRCGGLCSRRPRRSRRGGTRRR